jgi:DNA invertase Pin-like site-specific DNA recombinase
MLQTLIANRIHNAIYFCNMLIGYARVSKNEHDASTLEAAGWEMTFHEKASGRRWDRPELHRLLGQLRKCDVVVVWKLDRLSRSLKDVQRLYRPKAA